MFGKKCQSKPESIKGIRIQDLKNQLYLRSERTSGRIFKKTIRLEIAKRMTKSSFRIQEIRQWTLWKGWPPLKQKKSLLAALM
jgi:hypothetical protein